LNFVRDLINQSTEGKQTNDQRQRSLAEERGGEV